jgi:uncharacterized membrane protein
MADTARSRPTIVSVTFADRGKAKEGLEHLWNLESRGQVAIEALALITRDEDGRIFESHLTGEPWAGRAGGGLVGVLIGILGGPLGILLGASAGVLIGAMADSREVDQAESVLAEFSKALEVRQATVVAELVERDPAIVDSAMSERGGRVLRRSAADVEAEVAMAEKAQRNAEKVAREQLLKARYEMHKDEIHAKVEELKTKLDRGSEQAEASLETSARRAEASFYERGAKPEARLEETEQRLEKAAQAAEAKAYERGAKPEARLEEIEEHLESSARKVNALGDEPERRHERI